MQILLHKKKDYMYFYHSKLGRAHNVLILIESFLIKSE